MRPALTAVTVLLAVLLAGLTGFGLVSANSATPEPVDAPLVTYGTR